jgi:hypothetical protein
MEHLKIDENLETSAKYNISHLEIMCFKLILPKIVL